MNSPLRGMNLDHNPLSARGVRTILKSFNRKYVDNVSVIDTELSKEQRNLRRDARQVLKSHDLAMTKKAERTQKPSRIVKSTCK